MDLLLGNSLINLGARGHVFLRALVLFSMVISAYLLAGRFLAYHVTTLHILHITGQ